MKKILAVAALALLALATSTADAARPGVGAGRGFDRVGRRAEGAVQRAEPRVRDRARTERARSIATSHRTESRNVSAKAAPSRLETPRACSWDGGSCGKSKARPGSSRSRGQQQASNSGGTKRYLERRMEIRMKPLEQMLLPGDPKCRDAARCGI